MKLPCCTRPQGTGRPTNNPVCTLHTTPVRGDKGCAGRDRQAQLRTRKGARARVVIGQSVRKTSSRSHAALLGGKVKSRRRGGFHRRGARNRGAAGLIGNLKSDQRA